MSVKVYFETPSGSSAQLVAVFDTEDLYDRVAPLLSALARAEGYVLTESVDEESLQGS